VACALLATVGPGQIARAIALFVVASVGFEAGYIFYNALLAEVATRATLGRVSGLSWGTGFLGGLAALALCAPLLGPLPAAAPGYRLSFVIVALFFALVSLPTFLLVPESAAQSRGGSWRDHATAGLGRIRATLSHARRHRDAALLAAASACYYGGIETVIKFAAIYATVTFGMQGPELTRLFVLANLVAAPGTIAAGLLADRIGHRRALALSLASWFVLLGFGAIAASSRALWLLTPGIAIATGSTQAIGRAFLSRLAPDRQEAEFFGFYLLCNKAGSIVGLVLFGAISWASGSQRHALIAVAPLFLAALVLVLLIGAGRVAERESRT
jgi:UMF1 family MFS transporter